MDHHAVLIRHHAVLDNIQIIAAFVYDARSAVDYVIADSDVIGITVSTAANDAGVGSSIGRIPDQCKTVYCDIRHTILYLNEKVGVGIAQTIFSNDRFETGILS